MMYVNIFKTAALPLTAVTTLAVSATAQGGPDPSERQPLRAFKEAHAQTVTKTQTNIQSRNGQQARISPALVERRDR
ncbi:hypothetical protein ROA7450_00788 [Roseovarius albus]|uniref:Uncharacterized protein n=1 Tax=Roseovarius albus TaxID=1247867 RepID=A0A1X6YHD6_9RHOB|nr:hypothetical protein [Roseovarius albus]SLN21726.1 hypothetical protein ROA7450_00788 [Roseovarius albus]